MMTDVPYLPRIPLHDTQICANELGKVRFVNNQQIALCYARSAFPRYLVSAAHVYYVDNEVRQLPAVVRSQVVPSTFNQQDLGIEFAMQVCERSEILTDVFPNSSMRTASGLDGAYAFGRKGFVASEELAVLTGEDVVRDGGDVVLVAERKAQREHQGRLAGTDWSASYRHQLSRRP